MAERGIVYYNTGEKMAVRLAVSLHTLRKLYRGPITILSEGEPSHAFCEPLAAKHGCWLKKTVFNGTSGKNTTYLNACLVGNHTPYETTIWLDSDTICLRPFTELFEAAEKYEFAIAQFSTWKTQKKGGGHTKIGGRIECWRGILPDHWIDRALAFGPAINCGVFAFRKDSALIRDWHRLASQGQFKSFIPDEVCCQIMLAQPEYPNKIMPQHFNCSTKYSDPTADNVRIVHHHGRKHCRFEDGEPKFHSELWYRELDEIMKHDDWATYDSYRHKDRQLRQNWRHWTKWKSRNQSSLCS